MVYDMDEAGATSWDVTLKDLSRAAHPLNLQVAKAFCELMSCTVQMARARGPITQCDAGNLSDHAAQSHSTTEACLRCLTWMLPASPVVKLTGMLVVTPPATPVPLMVSVVLRLEPGMKSVVLCALGRM